MQKLAQFLPLMCDVTTFLSRNETNLTKENQLYLLWSISNFDDVSYWVLMLSAACEYRCPLNTYFFWCNHLFLIMKINFERKLSWKSNKPCSGFSLEKKYLELTIKESQTLWDIGWYRPRNASHISNSFDAEISPFMLQSTLFFILSGTKYLRSFFFLEK